HALAQAPSEEPTLTPELQERVTRSVAKAYEAAGSEVLLTYFPKDSFRIEASLNLGSYPRKLPYLSEVAYLRAVSEQPIEKLRKHIADLSLTVFLARGIASDAEEQITNLLRRQLGLAEDARIEYMLLTL